MLDAGGAPIQLDPRNGPPRAGADGSLRQDDKLVGALGLFNFDPGPNFVRFGNSGIVPIGEPEPVVDRLDVGVAQGFLEESNVNPVLEITRLIMVQRAFENGAALIRRHRVHFRRSHQDARLEIGAVDDVIPAAFALRSADAGQPARRRWNAPGGASPTSTR